MPKVNNNDVLFKCTLCGSKELIPIESVYFFDIFDPSDVGSPPCVGCKVCAGTMIPANSSYHN
jgi:hypothetical protein